MDSHFLLRRIHSLTGVVPVGLFLVYHIYLQLYLHYGAEIYNNEVNSFYDSPLATWALVIVVISPFYFILSWGSFWFLRTKYSLPTLISRICFTGSSALAA